MTLTYDDITYVNWLSIATFDYQRLIHGNS